jgi:SNF2 family DNA or RNA helicase
VLAAFDPLVQTLRLLQIASAMPVLDESGAVVALDKPSNKLVALQELLDERAGAPTLVFAASRKLIELCSREVGVDHVLITGAQTPVERAESVSRFQTGVVPLALVTLGAGGEGITLTAADTAVFLQRSWSLVQNLQAEDRIHRIGQDASAVNIIDVVSDGSIEARVLEAFAGKEQSLQDVVRDKAALRSLLV